MPAGAACVGNTISCGCAGCGIAGAGSACDCGAGGVQGSAVVGASGAAGLPEEEEAEDAAPEPEELPEALASGAGGAVSTLVCSRKML